MAKLELTQEEIDADTCLSFDDASLGKCVKYAAAKIGSKGDGRDIMSPVTLAAMLAGLAYRANADTFTIDLQGVTHKDKPIGDWIMTMQRVEDNMKKHKPYYPENAIGNLIESIKILPPDISVPLLKQWDEDRAKEEEIPASATVGCDQALIDVFNTAKVVVKSGSWLSPGADNYNYMGQINNVVGTDWNNLVAAVAAVK